jgi:hypothetical protein
LILPSVSVDASLCFLRHLIVKCNVSRMSEDSENEFRIQPE